MLRPGRPADPRHARLRDHRLAHDRAALRASAPGGYKDEHITHYTRARLIEILERHGFTYEETAYILKSELIMRFRKPEADSAPVKAPAPMRAASA